MLIDASAPIARLAVALAIGLLLGAERERRQTRDRRNIGGVRTFALTALLGGVCEYLGGVPLVVAGILLIGLIAIVGYTRSPAESRGVTTEVAMLVAFLLGVLAQRDPVLASAVGVGVTILLAVRVPLHRFVSSVLTDQEVHDALLLAAAAVVVLPLLPDRTIDPWGALNPARVFRLVVLLMLIMAAGYTSTRALGARAGLPISGLLGGFVSSTSTVASMGTRAREEPDAHRAAVAGAVLSTVATMVQLAAVLWATSPALLVAARGPLIAGTLGAVAFGAVSTLRARRAPQTHPEPGRAFDVKVVLGLATFLSVAALIVAVSGEWFGAAGIAVTAALGGLADAHGTATAVAAQVAGGHLGAQQAVLPVLYAFTTNTGMKLAMAMMTGGRGFALPVGIGLLVVLIAAWSAWLLG